MTFIREMLSEGGKVASTTRVCLFLGVLTCCAAIWRDIGTGRPVDAAVVAALLGTLAGLKGWEKSADQAHARHPRRERREDAQ